MSEQHYRRCWDCGHINTYASGIIPECLCRKCKSADTRKMKNEPPLWGESFGVYVPEQIAVCPECGEGLIAECHEHEAESGRPIATGIEVQCLCRVRAGSFEVNHRWHQSQWQPVRDAIAKWCDARKTLGDEMLIEIQTKDGLRKVRVCDYCRTVCIPSGRFCSGRCARLHSEYRQPATEQRKDGDQ